MKIISILLFSISTNLDNLPLSLILFKNNQALTLKQTLFLSIFISLSTLFMMLLAIQFSTFLNPVILSELSCASLIIIGMLSIYHALFHTIKPKQSQKTFFQLALTLLSNNLVTALPAALAGTPILYSSFFHFLSCFFFLEIGKLIQFQSNQSRDTLFISGLFLILLGILELYY